jgi:hypothetical protein
VGSNAVKLDALNQQGVIVGSDTITITNTGTAEPAAASNFVISELMYHPADPTEPGFTDADDFEFVELLNVGARTIELQNARFSAGIDFTFRGGTLAPGARLLLVRNQAAFEARYGAGLPIAGVYAGSLDNGGERLTLLDRAGGAISNFTYDDNPPWPADADGAGYSLTLIRPETLPDPNLPESWRLSRNRGGSPNTSDALPVSAFANTLDYAFAQLPAAENVDGFLEITARERLGADGVSIAPETSLDLLTWTPADPAILAREGAAANHDGTQTVRWRLLEPMFEEARAFVRFKVTPLP